MNLQKISTGLAGQMASVVSDQAATAKGDRPKVRLIFACWALVQDRPTWPHIGHDMRPEIERVSTQLPRLCPEVEFLPTVVHKPEEAEKILAEDAKTGQIDGYLVYQMNNWIRVMYPVVASGKPTIIAQYIYAGSGGFHKFTAELRRQYKNMAAISSSRLEDLAEAARKFTMLRQGATAEQVAQAAHRSHLDRMPPPQHTTGKEDTFSVRPISQVLSELEKETILCVGGGKGDANAISENMKIQVRLLTFPEFAEAYDKTDIDQAREIAARWKTQAAKIDIPDQEQTLEKSARVYLAQKILMEKYNASAIAINCLGGFYSGHLKGYPCLGFVELNDAGLVGACEADLLSTTSMLALRHLVGRPGYISDPVLDSSKRQIVYAHCVAPTKPMGPSGPQSPFEIYTHSEDRRGASVRSILPLGYMTTTLQIHPARREILCHRSVTVENPWSDRACRTKLAAEVLGDFERMYTFWDQYGWHRVTVYGDLWEPIRELAAALKFQFVPEA